MIPNAAGAGVLIGPGLVSAATITLGGVTRVGDLTLDSGQNIAITGTAANRLTFAESPPTGEALLSALGGGSHSVTHLGLESNLRVDVASGTGLAWAGSLTGTDLTIRKTGTGLLDLATPSMSLAGWTRGLWNIEEGRVRFGGSLGGSGTNSSGLRLAGGTLEVVGTGSTVLQGGWNITGPGGTVEVGAGRTVQVTGPITGAGGLTKTGAGTLALTAAGAAGSSFTGDFSFQGGVMAVSGAGNQQFFVRNGYEDVPTARYLITGASSITNLARAITFENGRTSVVTAAINLADQARGGIAASGAGTVVEVGSFIQSASGNNQNLYLSTRNGGVLVLGAGARIDSALANGDGRTSQYWDDGTGELRLAPGFVANYAPLDPATGWTGLDVFGGTLVSSESQNLPEFLRFNVPRVAGAENRWRTENANQNYPQAANFNANTRITTITDLQLSGTTLAAGTQLTKDGPGTLVLEPNASLNSFGAGSSIQVDAGTVQLGYQLPSAANITVTVDAGATLTGDGRMGPLNSSGTVAPGQPGVSFATLTATSLTLDATASYAVDLGTAVADVDLLAVTAGPVSLGSANLSLTLPAAPTPFIEYIIVDNQSVGPVAGTFSEGSTISADFGGLTYPFDILYNGGDGNDVVLLTLVPEPGAGSLAALGAGVWLLGRGRRLSPRR